MKSIRSPLSGQGGHSRRPFSFTSCMSISVRGTSWFYLFGVDVRCTFGCTEVGPEDAPHSLVLLATLHYSYSVAGAQLSKR